MYFRSTENGTDRDSAFTEYGMMGTGPEICIECSHLAQNFRSLKRTSLMLWKYAMSELLKPDCTDQDWRSRIFLCSGWKPSYIDSDMTQFRGIKQVCFKSFTLKRVWENMSTMLCMRIKLKPKIEKPCPPCCAWCSYCLQRICFLHFFTIYFHLVMASSNSGLLIGDSYWYVKQYVKHPLVLVNAFIKLSHLLKFL